MPVFSDIECYVAMPLTNDVICLGKNGLKLFSTVTDYGDIKNTEDWAKVNKYLARYTDEAAKMWHISSRKEVWIKPNNSGSIVVFHYIDGRFSMLNFLKPIADVVDKDNNVYIASGDKIMVLDDTIATEDGLGMQKAVFKSKSFYFGRGILVKNISGVFESYIPGVCNITIGNLTYNVSGLLTNSPSVFMNNDDVLNNIGDVYTNSRINLSTNQNYRSQNLDITITVESGRFGFRDMTLTVADM